MKSFLWRLVRTFGSVAISSVAVVATEDPKLILFAPVISATAKLLRDKFGLKKLPL